jgi:hypothetical protein
MSFHSMISAAVLACVLLASTARAQEAEPSMPGVRGWLGAGLGAAARSLSMPSLEGARHLTTLVHPALEVTLRGEAVLAPHALLSLDARYRTSLGLDIEETPLGGVARTTPLRVHTFGAGLVPAWRFAVSDDSAALGLYLGWSVQAVSAAVAPTIPTHTLHGPELGIELRAPLARSAVVFALRPSVAIWPWATERLRDQGRLSGPGLAFGLDAGVDIRLTDAFVLALAYHGASGSMPSELGSLATNEHAGTARAVVAF